MAYSLATGATSPAIYPSGSASPTTAYSGTFIPEIWSGKLIEKFYASTVLAAISNSDYEGEIRNQGDKVKIRTKPTITINDYRADGSLSLERPSSNVVELNIDQGKYFNTILDDVMDIQSDINQLNLWSEDAAEQMKIKIDDAVLLGLLDDAHASNRGTTAGAISASINLGVTATPLTVVARSPGAGEVEVVDLVVRLGQALDEQNIPETGRWIIMPAWFCSMVKRSELRDASLSGDGASILRNGRLGMVDRFTLYSSNLLPTGVADGLAASEFAIYAGHAHGLTFASQMTKLETLRSEMTFGTIMRGLQVYGYKTVDSTAIAQAICIAG